jgi:hypothetical protein
MATGGAKQWWLVALLAVLLSPLIMTFLLALLALDIAAGVVLYLAVWCWWLPRGRDTLIVYSDSPVWHAHMQERVLATVGSRAVVLNWSQRRHWNFGLASAVFRYFGGKREFNPLAVVFRPFRRARVFRFWEPFRDWKHGRPQALEQVEAELFACLGLTKSDFAA